MRFICVVFLVFFQFTNAQKHDPLTAKDVDTLFLSEALQEMEAIHDIKFAYNPNQISQKKIALNPSTLSLEESILAIENTFRIIFEKIDERYYTLKIRTKNISICGHILDENKKPILGANIINNITKQGVTSNEEGYFTLENNNANDIISISFLGYETTELIVDQISVQKCDALILAPISYALEEVVVQEYLGAGIVKVKDGAIKIDPNNLDILSGLSEPDILQNIQLLPGIESPGETASGLYIRGGSPDQNLILWDGIKMYNSNHFFGMISAFNPYITKDVSIFRSGTDPKYGDRISGVIDIQTDDTVPTKFEGQIGVNTLHGDFNLKFPLSKNIGLYVSARRSLIDLFRSPTFNTFAQKVFQNTSIDEPQGDFDIDFAEEQGIFNFFDFNIKTVFKLSEVDKLTISALQTENNLDFSLRPENSNDASSDQLNITNWGTNTTWTRFWNNRLKSKVSAYYSNHKFDYAGQNPFLNQELTTTSKDNTIKEIGFSSHIDWSINDRWTFSNGYQFFSNRVGYTLAYNDFNASDNTLGSTHGLYSQLKYEKEDRWNIGIGVRSNYYGSLRSNYIEPRIYIERVLNKNLRLKASAELKNQAVSQIVEFVTQDLGLENQVWALAKEDGIPLLKSDQLSVGFLYSPHNGWHLDVDAYYKNIDGFTTYTRGFESFQEDLSEGNSLIKGIDVLLKKKFGNYTSWLGYTYSTTSFLFDEINQGERFSGNNDIRNSLTWSHFYKWKNFQFSLGWKYRNGIPFSQAQDFSSTEDGFIINYGPPNAKSLPDYHRLDFSVLYDFKLSKRKGGTSAKMGFSLLNLYGRRNVINRNYGLVQELDQNGNVTNTALRQIDKFSLGITPNLFFRIKF